MQKFDCLEATPLTQPPQPRLIQLAPLAAIVQLRRSLAVSKPRQVRTRQNWSKPAQSYLMIASGKALKMWSDYLKYLSLNDFKKNYVSGFNDFFIIKRSVFKRLELLCVCTKFFGFFLTHLRYHNGEAQVEGTCSYQFLIHINAILLWKKQKKQSNHCDRR